MHFGLYPSDPFIALTLRYTAQETNRHDDTIGRHEIVPFGLSSEQITPVTLDGDLEYAYFLSRPQCPYQRGTVDLPATL